MNTVIVKQNVTADRMQSHREWMSGFESYMDGKPFDEEQPVNWRMGYRQAQVSEDYCHAVDAAAYCGKELGINVEEELVDYVEDQLDRQYWREGKW